MMNVGVKWYGRIFCVEFEVNDSKQLVNIVGIEEVYRDGRKETIDRDSDLGRELSESQQFYASTIYAVANWTGKNFNFETFKRQVN